jgi:hypothetical protein
MGFIVRFWGYHLVEFMLESTSFDLSGKTHRLINFGFRIPLNLVYQIVVSLLGSFWLCGLDQPYVSALAKKIYAVVSLVCGDL